MHAIILPDNSNSIPLMAYRIHRTEGAHLILCWGAVIWPHLYWLVTTNVSTHSFKLSLILIQMISADKLSRSRIIGFSCLNKWIGWCSAIGCFFLPFFSWCFISAQWAMHLMEPTKRGTASILWGVPCCARGHPCICSSHTSNLLPLAKLTHGVFVAHRIHTLEEGTLRNTWKGTPWKAVGMIYTGPYVDPQNFVDPPKTIEKRRRAPRIVVAVNCCSPLNGTHVPVDPFKRSVWNENHISRVHWKQRQSHCISTPTGASTSKQAAPHQQQMILFRW